MPLRRLILLTVGAALIAAAPAAADTPLAAVDADTPIAAQGAWIAFSQQQDDGAYRLMLAHDGHVEAAPVDRARQPFDVTLGRDGAGRIVATYSRCDAHGHDCDAYRYSVEHGHREAKLRSISSRSHSERWPAEWRGTFSFVRTGHCDAPYVHADGHTRRLDRGHCATVTGQALRGSTIVQTAITRTTRNAPTRSEIRRLSVHGGRPHLLASQAFGEESNVFGAPSIYGRYAYVTRTGLHPTPSFVRVALSDGHRVERPAGTMLVGPAARDGGRTAYLEGEGLWRGGDCGPQAPCRVVVADRDPFGDGERTLAPRLTLHLPDAPVPADRALDVTGELSAPVVRHGKVVRSTPLDGVSVELTAAPYREGNAALPVRPTGRTATTGADGRFAITLPAPLPTVQYVGAVTHERVPAATLADNVNGEARIGLDVSATRVPSGGAVTFSGSIGPAQPGREIKIQRRTAHRCQKSVDGREFCQDEWATVGQATVAADGASYTATLPLGEGGIYTAVLPFVRSAPPGQPLPLNGRSAPVTIAVG